MTNNNSTVAIYPSHTAVETAIKKLLEDAFEMKKLSIIGRDYQTDEHVVGYYNIGDRMKVWGKTSAFWGGLSGVIFGSALFWIPGLGPLIVAGPLVGWLVGTLDGALVVDGMSPIGAVFYSLNIPTDSILRYEKVLTAGKFILLVHGSMDETINAKKILESTEPETLEHHFSKRNGREHLAGLRKTHHRAVACSK
ncbi:MAG: permease [Lentisphaerae bacterium GWF2_44_16]|nr:MAG: permease [Lentisphaerae bacterium GWF2_44_16]